MWFLQPGITIEYVLMRILVALIVIFLVIPFHEYLQAYVAYKLGDSTAKSMGLMTINPIEHFYPLGAFLVLIFGIPGWANNLPINSSKFKSPKKGIITVGIIGLAAYLLSAMLGALIVNFLFIFYGKGDYVLNLFISQYVRINVSMILFELLPIPPMDGYKILSGFVSENFLIKYSKHQLNMWIIFYFSAMFGILDVPFYFLSTSITSFIFKITSLPFLFIR